ncbi:hypothetical protein SLEP1_g39485 [Rubroshorea leprosula]|uniref:Uncharacterized protein n=1 Tax=Rubroshorea leprosula TaxID=152421 RepID=A0AAV5L121_9ROSI|nr:hypothetical protein SLEP1_g39485 [Rubroshorea leprosula]
MADFDSAYACHPLSGGYQPITQIFKGGRQIPRSGGHGAVLTGDGHRLMGSPRPGVLVSRITVVLLRRILHERCSQCGSHGIDSKGKKRKMDSKQRGKNLNRTEQNRGVLSC